MDTNTHSAPRAGLGLLTGLGAAPSRAPKDGPVAQVNCPRCNTFLGRNGGIHCGACRWTSR